MKNTKVTGVRLTNEMKPGPMDHHIGRRLLAGSELKIDDVLGIEAGTQFLEKMKG